MNQQLSKANESSVRGPCTVERLRVIVVVVVQQQQLVALCLPLALARSWLIARLRYRLYLSLDHSQPLFRSFILGSRHGPPCE